MAVTRMLPATPWVRGLVSPETTNFDRTAGVTTMPVWLPWIDAVTVSVAVTDWVPAVLRARLVVKTWVPASATMKV